MWSEAVTDTAKPVRVTEPTPGLAVLLLAAPASGANPVIEIEPVPGARRELFEAMVAIAATGHGPAEQWPSLGCSIKWRPGLSEP